MSLADRALALRRRQRFLKSSILRWATAIEREAAQTDETALRVLRAHNLAIDQKLGVVGGLTGFLAAAVAFLAPGVLAAPRDPLAFGLLVCVAFTTLLAATLIFDALGTVSPLKDEDIEARGIVNLADRSRKYWLAYYVAQSSGMLLAVLGGGLGERIWSSG